MLDLGYHRNVTGEVEEGQGLNRETRWSVSGHRLLAD